MQRCHINLEMFCEIYILDILVFSLCFGGAMINWRWYVSPGEVEREFPVDILFGLKWNKPIQINTKITFQIPRHSSMNPKFSLKFKSQQ